MGEVYEARHSRLAGRYAVKVLHPEIRQHAEVLRRFQREAQVTSALRHPGIVQVIDFNIAVNGAPYLVMEYLDGRDLGQVIASEGPLSVGRVVDMATQIASALSAAHRTDVVHRDLKPQNVFLLAAEGDEPERIKILDFGISKIRSMSAKLTGVAMVVGTPQYMAPEQAEGKDEVDAAVDQFALAAIVYELLSGRPAFSGGTLASVVYQIVHIDPAPLSRLRPDLPEEVSAVVARGLSKKKGDRFPSATEFARTLRQAARLALPGSNRRRRGDSGENAHGVEKQPLSSHQDDRDDIQASPAKDAEAAGKPPLAGRTRRPATNAVVGATALFIALAVAATVARLSTRAGLMTSNAKPDTPPQHSGDRQAQPAPIHPPEAAVAVVPSPVNMIPAAAAPAPSSEPMLPSLGDRAPRAPVVALPFPARSLSRRASPVESSSTRARAAGRCSLTIGSTPWAELWLNGKNTHRHTPIRSMPVPCGPRRVTLKRRDLAIEFHTDIVVRPDEEFHNSYQIGFPE